MRTAAAGTVVIGIGNIVLSDDGLGVHAVRRLRERHAAPGVEIIEGGTAGLLLLPHLADARRAILVNAIDVGAPAGTLVRLEGEAYKRALSTGLTAHEVGLADLLAAARISGAWPENSSFTAPSPRRPRFTPTSARRWRHASTSWSIASPPVSSQRRRHQRHHYLSDEATLERIGRIDAWRSSSATCRRSSPQTSWHRSKMDWSAIEQRTRLLSFSPATMPACASTSRCLGLFCWLAASASVGRRCGSRRSTCTAAGRSRFAGG